MFLIIDHRPIVRRNIIHRRLTILKGLSCGENNYTRLDFFSRLFNDNGTDEVYVQDCRAVIFG